jgi:hypothetical protein
MTKRKNTMYVSPSMNALCDALPITKAAAVVLAIHNAWKEPDVLAYALRLRLGRPVEEKSLRISYSVDGRTEGKLKNLMDMTGLSGEETVRLAMEAYIHHL